MKHEHLKVNLVQCLCTNEMCIQFLIQQLKAYIYLILHLSVLYLPHPSAYLQRYGQYFVGLDLNYCKALLHGMTQTTLIVCRGYNTHLSDLSAMRCTVVHPSHYLNLCISYQSSNAFSKNSLRRGAKSRLHQQPSYLLQHTSQYQPARSLRSSNSMLLTILFCVY